MKKAFVVTINEGYMFALNCAFNANKFFGTNADFHVLYHHETPEEYRTACTKAFAPYFKIVWTPLLDGYEYRSLYGAFYSAKYKRALDISDEYDSVCIIDGDYFLCCDVTQFFHRCIDGPFIAAGHVHSGDVEMEWGNPEAVINRCQCGFADFPVFIDCKRDKQFLTDWFDYCHAYPEGDERSHPLIAFNRAIVKNYTKDNVLMLEGDHWVFDRVYWIFKLKRVGNELQYEEDNSKIFGIHNRWWQSGRAETEIRNGRASPNIDTGMNNMNLIRDFMAEFNEMTPESKRNDYEKKIFA